MSRSSTSSSESDDTRRKYRKRKRTHRKKKDSKIRRIEQQLKALTDTVTKLLPSTSKADDDRRMDESVSESSGSEASVYVRPMRDKAKSPHDGHNNVRSMRDKVNSPHGEVYDNVRTTRDKEKSSNDDRVRDVRDKGKSPHEGCQDNVHTIQDRCKSPNPGQQEVGDTQDHDSKHGDDIELYVLDDELKQLLGEEPSSSAQKGSDFHSEIASRWSSIAKLGMSKEERDRIRSNFKPPKNCEFSGPALNNELTKAVNPFTRNRDDDIRRIQNNIEVVISGLGETLSTLLSDNTPVDRKDLVRKLSDCGRFLVGTQYQLSLCRRKQVRASVRDNSMQELLQDSPIYPSLFGEDLSTKVKQMQSLTKLSHEIAKAPSTAQSTKPMKSAITRPARSDTARTAPVNRTTSSSRGSLNSRRPLSYRQKPQNYYSRQSGRSNRR